MKDVEQKVPAIVTAAMAVALLALCATAAHFFLSGEAVRPAAPAGPAALRAPAPGPHADPAAWSGFKSSSQQANGETSPAGAARRFRLAGTFFTFDETGKEARRAILDDREKKNQLIVGQGESVEDYAVVEVGTNFATLVRAGERTTLRLGAEPAAGRLAVSSNAPPPNLASSEEKVLEETPFGQRVGERRWVLSRERLMDYYQQLVEEPERIASLYMSLKPDYRDNEIAGYRLNQEGERDFFKAVGFQEGDVVRKVNAMNMTSQARAEYFLSEFVKSRLNAVVIDVERNGEPQKLIYLIR